MKILHICWGLESSNGAANIARLIMNEQRAVGHEPVLVSRPTWRQLCAADQIWCHCGWYWVIWMVVFYKVLFRRQVSIYWMPECCYDPVRLTYHGWKKRMVGPIERWALRRCNRIIATCEVEKKWILDYVWPCRNVERVEVTDIKRFFNLDTPVVRPKADRHLEPIHVLYLGRPHPLKGVHFLKQAVEELNASSARNTQVSQTEQFSLLIKSENKIELRCESNLHGKELEAAWDWCDIFCLPTLSDNFGLVVAEAIERGKCVITTDGAPAWSDFKPRNNSDPHGFVYLRGYREGSDEKRIELLKDALKRYVE